MLVSAKRSIWAGLIARVTREEVANAYYECGRTFHNLGVVICRMADAWPADCVDAAAFQLACHILPLFCSAAISVEHCQIIGQAYNLFEKRVLLWSDVKCVVITRYFFLPSDA